MTPRLGICCSIVIGPTSRMVGFFNSSKRTKPEEAALNGCLLFRDFGSCSRIQSGEPSGWTEAQDPSRCSLS